MPVWRTRALRHRALGMERLESRQMLAGNVTAFLDGRTLVVRGDEEGNGFNITSTGPGSVLVSAIDYGGETTINHGTEASFNNIRNIVVNSGDSGDFFSVAANITGDITIDTGEGLSDAPALTNVFARNVTIRGNNNFKIVALNDVHAADVRIEMGSGFNQLFISDCTFRKLTAKGGADVDQFGLYGIEADEISIQLGDDNDSLNLGQITARKRISYNGGSGNDSLGQFGPSNRRPVITNFEFDVFREQVAQSLSFLLEAGQSDTKADTEQQNFVTDYQVTLDGRGRPQATPLSTNYTTGLAVTAKVDEIAPDGRFVTVSVAATFTHVDDVRFHPVPLPGGLRFLQQPVVGTRQVSTAVSVPDGGTVMLAGDKQMRSRVNEFANGFDTSLDALGLATDPDFPLVRDEARFSGGLQLMVTPTIVEQVASAEPTVEVEVRAVFLQEEIVPRVNFRTQGDDARLNQLDSLKMTLLDGETRTVSHQATQPMLTSYDVTTRRNGRATIDPVVTDVETGMSLTAAATISSDRRFVAVDLDLVRTELEDVLTETIWGPFGPAQIQLPKLAETHFVSHVQVPDGGTILIGTIRSGNETFRAMLTPRIIINEEEEITAANAIVPPQDLQATLEIRFVRVTGEDSGDGISLNSSDQTESSVRHTIHERFLTDIAVATLPGGMRTIQPVVQTSDYGLQASQLPDVFDDRSGADFQVQVVGTFVDRVRTALVLTPIGVYRVRRPELANFTADFPVSLIEFEPVSAGPFADSRGGEVGLDLNCFIIIQDESVPGEPQTAFDQAVLRIDFLR